MKRPRRHSITLRLTLLFAAAATAVLLTLGYLVGGSVTQHFADDDLEMLTGKLHLVQHALTRLQRLDDPEALGGPLRDALVGHHGLSMRILAPNGSTLFATPEADFPAQLVEHPGSADDIHALHWTNALGMPQHGIAVLAPTGVPGGAPVLVAIGLDTSHHAHFMHGFQRNLWFFVALAAALTGLLGWGAVRRGLAPLRQMKEEAAGICAHRLDTRLAVEQVPVELAELAETLNAMLARLENSFQRLSDFSSDIAHELRTPVSNLLTQTQVTLSRARSAEEYAEVLAANSEELERLSRMISDMLYLAKSENGLATPNRERVDLHAETLRLFDFYEALAEEKGIHLSCDGEGGLLGDRMMIARALSNLLSNAIRHTPPEGQVRVQIEQTEEALTLCVENTGENIPPEHLSRLFDRFYRVDASRQRDSSGAGLGLAITRSIALAHDGGVEVSSQDGLTRFTLRFPSAERPGL